MLTLFVSSDPASHFCGYTASSPGWLVLVSVELGKRKPVIASTCP